LSWDDLAWTNLDPATRFITAASEPTIHPDENNKWGTDSATMAFILFQKPSMVAIHAGQMLSSLS
jgi:hypothetical protein